MSSMRQCWNSRGLLRAYPLFFDGELLRRSADSVSKWFYRRELAITNVYPANSILKHAWPILPVPVGQHSFPIQETNRLISFTPRHW
jgi:hypothetical protein